MKQTISFIAIVLTVFLLACQDGKDEVQKNISDFSYYRSIGEQIPNETGLRWLQLFKDRNHVGSRTSLSGYSVTRDQLTSLMASAGALTGIAFSHGIDGEGVHHFILVPIDESLSVWNGGESRIYIDANSGAQISREIAREWASTFRSSNPGEVWLHYFGRDVFDEVLQNTTFDPIDIEPALSDIDLSPQVLVIINAPELLDGVTGGREESEVMVYDKSFPCSGDNCPLESE